MSIEPVALSEQTTQADGTGEVRLALSPMAGALGAVCDHPILDDHRPEVLAALRAAMDTHDVIYFRGQPDEPRKLHHLAEQLGPLRVQTEDVRGKPIVHDWPDMPALAWVDVRANEWHTDQTIMDPNRFTLLQCATTPAYGGDTEWASLTAAYDALSERMKTYLRGLEAVHNGWRVGAPNLSNTHPLVRVHPVTGRPSLYLNRTYTNEIVGLPWRESRAVLDMLFAHCEQPRFACRWRWQPGDVVVWDNSCTIHVALDDYPADAQRDMYHVNVRGDVPVAY